jgi:inhibitor of KinA sporulation pathway (predicted exonuclease)
VTVAALELLALLRATPDVLVVWDTEFTAWPGSQERGWTGPGEHRELVQIGAVALDATAGLTEIAVFERIVQPKINPRLSQYFIDLTDITQQRVDREGVTFPRALDDFAAFANRWMGSIGAFGRDDLVLSENCALHGFVAPIAPGRFRDLRPALEAAIGRTGMMSSELPRFVGLPSPEQAHDALADARAIASVLRHFTMVAK